LFTVSIVIATVNLPVIAGFTMAAFLLSGREKIGVNHDGIYQQCLEKRRCGACA